MQTVTWGPHAARSVAIAVALLSLADLILTLLGIATGVVSEANPWMNALLQHSVGMFVAAKVGATGFFLVLMGRYGGNLRWARLPAFAVCGLYLGVMGMHARWLVAVVNSAWLP